MNNTLIEREKKSNRINNIFKVLSLALACFAVFPVMAFAEAAGGDAISAAVIKVCQDVGGLMTTILNPVCAVIIGFCILCLITGKSSKSADSSMQWIKRVAICFVAFNCIGLFLTYGTSLVSGLGGNAW